MFAVRSAIKEMQILIREVVTDLFIAILAFVPPFLNTLNLRNITVLTMLRNVLANFNVFYLMPMSCIERVLQNARSELILRDISRCTSDFSRLGEIMNMANL